MGHASMATTRLLVLPESPVWVMEDDGAATAGQAAAIAGRLGMPFRRIGAAGPAGRVRAGSGPELVLSAGSRSGAQALLLRARHGCRIVHCAGTRPPLPSRLAGYPFDLMVLPSARARPDTAADLARLEARDITRLMPVLGPPHVVSPALLARARDLWAERLGHLPEPRIAVLLGGGIADPRAAAALAERLGQMARQRQGCVLVSALAACPPDVAAAFAAGLSACLNLIHREGEPGENPMLGFLGIADAVVVAWAGPQALSEACAASAPVFVVPSPPGRALMGDGGLMARLMTLDQVRPLQEGLLPWPRTPLDEAGRIARTIVRRFAPGRTT